MARTRPTAVYFNSKKSMDIFIKILKFIFALVEFCLRVLYEGIFGGVHRDTLETGYNAKFIDEDDLISGSNKGFCLNGKKNLSKLDSHRNLLICGTTGSFKSTSVIFPSIENISDSSIILHDPSGELYQKTAKLKQNQGFKVYVLNFGSPENSLGYNPLFYAKTIAEINKVATALVKNTVKNTGDDFWNIQAINLISLMISILKTQDYDYQNLYNVRYLISTLGSSPESIDSLFAQHASPQLLLEYKNMISYDSKVLASCIASAQASLQLFIDENIAKLTSIHQIDFNRLRKEKSIIYIQNATSDILYFKPLISLIFEQLFRHITLKLPEKSDLDLFFLIDEFSSLTLPSIPIFLSNCRKYRTGVALSIQNIAQMANFYGKENSDTIFANTLTKVFFSGASLQDATMLEQTLGKVEIFDEKGSKVINLMNAQNLRTMDTRSAIIVHASKQPIHTRLTPYFENIWKSSKYEDSEPFINPHVPHEIPILPLT
jgi:type IV secretion system protein VirD4